MNVSLDDSEYNEYITILEEIAKNVSGIYTVTNSDGSVVLKLNGSIVDLTEATNKLKEHIKNEAYVEAKKTLNDPKVFKDRADLIKGSF
jgi:hypothetical protein